MGRLFVLVAVLAGLSIKAATFSVSSIADSGAGTLRQAITQANASPGTHTIIISVSGTIELLTVLPDLRANVTIAGPGRDELTVRRSGTGAFRIFTVATNRTVTVAGMTLANGNGAAGGAVLNGGQLSVVDTRIAGNQATNPFGDGGGGILNYGTLNVTNSLIVTNQSANWGGGVRNMNGSFVLHETLIAGNRGGGGGGVANNNGTGVVSRSTVSGNYAFHGGAGIITYFGSTLVTNSTISSNATQSSVGGGGLLTSYGELTVSYSTIYGNQAVHSGSGGGVRNEVPANTFIESSIVASNQATRGPDVFGVIQSLDFNLIANPGGGTIRGQTNETIFYAPPLLLPLADYGGPTPTHAPQPGSPAIDRANPARFPAVDQRGAERPESGGPDIGAVEGTVGEPIPAAQPQIVRMGQNNGTFTMGFTSSAGQTYAIDYRDDLSAPWTTLVSGIVGNGQVVEVTDSLAQAQRFYRVRTE